MKALPPPTAQLPVLFRQLSMPLDSQKLCGLNKAERATVIARLAVLLMAAAGVVTQETIDDQR